MKQAYPIILTDEKDMITVYIPDFEANTQGKDLAEAIEMARDVIGLMGIDMEDDKKDLPQPSDLSSAMQYIKSHDDIISLVDVDFSEYRRKNEMKTVKKNCTIPSWLNFEAEKAHINFSAVLQEGLRRELKL